MTPDEFEKILETDYGDGLRIAGRKALEAWRATERLGVRAEALEDAVEAALRRWRRFCQLCINAALEGREEKP